MNKTEYSYAKLILEMIKLSEKHKIDHKIIGYEKFDKIGMIDPIYRFIINSKAKIHFGVVAGVQAYEIAGPLTILELFKNPQKYFKKEICYHIYPVINPTSWDLRQRMNDKGVDLNLLSKHALNSKNFKEVQAFYKDIKHLHFNAFISLHEDVDETKFYSYVFETKIQPLYRDIIKKTEKHIQILKKAKIYGDESNKKGLLINKHDRSFEDFLFCRKKANISLCTETPGKLPINKRIAENIQNLNIISEYLLKN